MEGEEKKMKKHWSKEETMAFLEFYKIRESEFQHSRKKKFAYANVLEDMISGGYIDSNTKPVHLEIKMAALLRAYKASRDRSKRTAAAPCVAPFLKQMEEIFGSRSKNLNNQTISCGAIDMEIEMELNKEKEHFDSIDFSTYSMSQPEFGDETHPRIKCEPSHEDHLHFVSPENITSSLPASNTPPSSIPSLKLNQNDYYEKRLRHLNRSDKERSKRWEQYLKIQAEKAERHREKMNKLDSIINLLLKRRF
ncbi:uncharacterized protein LOC129909079 [Episyrphus balteatus]|uniref:uncharacterized protein LOC129909079 n=1 Tax=Episyrphus balteatus TaxID=286459 RepID=UPI002485F26E|nr:uncharacterized protein LOC129909079 [Episyrphus balteatus]XP_055842005.1 uncharacterized protein LOC129909079 [Episyrphus balteatus]